MAVINGNSGNNFLVGTSSNDQIYGFDGFDTLNGSGGDDFLSGGRQNDRLFGDSGADDIFGGKDNDSISGGSGTDVLNGDQGNDTLQGNGGFDVVIGGSGADTFIGTGDGDIAFVNQSEGDRVVGAGISSPSRSSLSTVSEESNIPFLELKQQGSNLLISFPGSEGYMTLVGSGELINDPTELLSSITFVNDPLLGNYEETSEPETDSEPFDLLTRLRQSEATLIQAIEHLEARGSLYNQGIPGPAGELQAALSDIQGLISDELARQESFLLPGVVQPEKQVFVFEEGTAIPLNIQEEMMGSEIFFMPSGYFNATTPEGLF